MMDCDWKCLIDEMWESYLCEENMENSSFYELDENLINWNNHTVYEHFPINCQDWEPCEHLFDLMEDVALYSDNDEKQSEKSVTATKDLKSQNSKFTTKQKKAKNAKDAETNTRKMQKALKSKSRQTRKKNNNTKNSNHSSSKHKTKEMK